MEYYYISYIDNSIRIGTLEGCINASSKEIPPKKPEKTCPRRAYCYDNYNPNHTISKVYIYQLNKKSLMKTYIYMRRPTTLVSAIISQHGKELLRTSETRELVYELLT